MASHLPLRDTTPPARRWPFISPHFRARRLRACPKPNPRHNGLVSHGDWAADLKLLHRRHSPMLLLLAPCSSLCLSPFTMLPPCFILAAGHGPHPGRAAVEFRPDLLSQRLQEFHVLPPLRSVLHNLIYDGGSQPVQRLSLFSTFSSYIPRLVFLCPC